MWCTYASLELRCGYSCRGRQYNKRYCLSRNNGPSVAEAQADIFAIFGNKMAKSLKIFGEVDHLKILRSLSQL
jgi:hypothetical protein